MEDHEIAGAHHSPWRPENRPIIQAVTGKLGEEVNELGTIINRINIQGFDETDPTTGKLNKQILEEEIADVMGLCLHAMERLHLDLEKIDKRAGAKYNMKAKWFDEFEPLPKPEN